MLSRMTIKPTNKGRNSKITTDTKLHLNNRIIHSQRVILFTSSFLSKFIVSHSLLTTAFNVLIYFIAEPHLTPSVFICFQIYSMGFISSVYGGICVIMMFPEISKFFDLCHTASSQTRITISSLYLKTLILLVLQFGIIKKNFSPRKGRSTAPKTCLYSLIWWAGNAGSELVVAPAILRLVNSSKTCFVFKCHK